MSTHSERSAKGLAKQAEMRAAGLMETLDPLERSARNPQSLDLAIKAMCYECTGRDEPGGSIEIATCDHWDCPLWQFRPHQGRAPEAYGAAAHAAYLARQAGKRGAIGAAAKDQGSRRKAAKAKCLQCMGGNHQLVSSCNDPFPRDQFGLATPQGWRGCPLHPHRSGSGITALKRAENIAISQKVRNGGALA